MDYETLKASFFQESIKHFLKNKLTLETDKIKEDK